MNRKSRQKQPRVVPNRPFPSATDGNQMAWFVVACVPTIGIFSFNGAGIADLAVAVLVLGGIFEIVRGDTSYRRTPVGLSLGWIGFVILSAGYARLFGLSGAHFGSIGKQIPLALGPLAAVALGSASERLGLALNRFVILFLAGIGAGAILMLLRNGAGELFVHGRVFVADGRFGAVNRNYAAFGCGVAIVSFIGIFCHQALSVGFRSTWTALAAITTAIVVFLCATALIALQSRTAILATTASLLVWLLILVRSTFGKCALLGRGIVFAVPIILIIVAACSFYIYQRISDRPLLEGSAVEFANLIPILLEGRLTENVTSLAKDEARLQLAAVAIDLIRQRPWFGWGPDASRLIGVFSPFPDLKELNQFHNGYLQEIVSFGIVGTTLMLALLTAILRSAYRAYGCKITRHELSPSLFAVAVSLVFYVAIYNATETILFVKPAAMICAFFVAVACFPRHHACDARSRRQNR